MVTNYLKIAWRNLARNKVISTINILGLALGMAVVLLIAIYVRNEFKYDQFIENKDHVYRVYRYWAASGGQTVWTPSRLGEKIQSEFPEVIAASGLAPSGEILMEYRGDKMFVEETANVDSTFFQTMALPFLKGDPHTALDNPDGVVISDRLAKRMFGEANPIGETVRIDGDSDMQITGVLALSDKQTHVNYDMFMRFTWYADSWSGNNRATYIRMQPNASEEGLEGKITAVMKPLIEKELLSMNYVPKPEEMADWKLQPLNDIHLHSSDFYWMDIKQGNIRYVYIFLLIAALILAVAIVNYVNLATAQATKRAKEVGVRKATGAVRCQLTGQFMTEAIFQASLAALVGLVLAEALLPFFNTVTDRELGLLGSNSWWALLPLLGLTLVTGLLAGFYPALVLSGFQPVKALKTNFLKTNQKGSFRKVLVTGQFAITISLLVVMAFIYRQVDFMMKHELGFQPDQIVTIPLNEGDSYRKVQTMKTAFTAIPGVKAITTCNATPGNQLPDWGLQIEGVDEAAYPLVVMTDADYTKVMDMELVEGRFFSPDIAGDTLNNYLVNEAFVRDYDIREPIGQRIKFTSDTTYGQIVGVVKDYHYQGLQNKIRPLMMCAGDHQRSVALKLETSDLSNTIFAIENLMKQVEPEHPMRYSFLDADFAQQYEEQERFGQTLIYATFLTMFIAILGLFGLTAFNVERRTKEIGVRKVLGASIGSIVGLLSKDFLLLVGIAFLIAIPVGWYVTNLWLEDFAFRTDMVWWVFALAGFGAILVAFLTMGFQSVRAAMMNPVESLRNE